MKLLPFVVMTGPTDRRFAKKIPDEPLKTVASEGPILSKIGRVAGAQEPECTFEYMRIPSTAGAQHQAQ